MKKLLAKKITGSTMLGVGPQRPTRGGNCFSVLADNGAEYRIVNFCCENLEHCTQNGIDWPVKIEILGGNKAVINDERIPDKWYAARFCETCCPDSLLPENQRMKHRREEALGNRESGDGFIKLHYKNSPIDIPEVN